MKNKSMGKLMKGLLVSTMALSMCLGTAGTVFASEHVQDGDNQYMQGTQEHPAEAYIKKNLKMAEGMNTPEGKFVFQFKRTSEDTSAPTAAMPEITDKKIEYKSGRLSATDGLIQAEKMSDNIVDGLTFGHAGEYVYNVTEKTGKENFEDYTWQENEDMDFSKAEYKMTVIVANKLDENGKYIQAADGGYKTYIKYIAVQKVRDDKGNEVNGKVDPENDLEKNTFIFENTFTRIGNTVPNQPGTPGYPMDPNDPSKPDPNYPIDPDYPGTPVDPADPDAHNSLTISKTVTNDGDLSKDFKFNLTLQKSKTEADSVTSYDAYKIDQKGTKTKITVTVGTATPFELKHDEKLVFPLLPVGTKYDISETAVTGYTTTLITKEDGQRESNEQGISAENKLVGDETNYAKYTNDKPSVPPTGILINNLPFILLILVAVGGFVAFIISKRHRRVR
ncbi:hypothetical protein DWX43_17055 [Clostridium sp. AF19-22AC]|jgi:hypothetical protein|uniref:DUF7601 domain-containing protein n=1 Tax=Clostridia TaxID=186801 RepID=UPI000E4E87AA|nr:MULTISPECIES: FctA domain-containing protein [Clostridia]RHR25833.1 hypothetical protein DWX43_17055 [Clostridium sp. AF19-22AC]